MAIFEPGPRDKFQTTQSMQRSKIIDIYFKIAEYNLLIPNSMTKYVLFWSYKINALYILYLYTNIKIKI